MEVGKLTVKAREGFGKGPSRRLRAEGLIPGICYGHKVASPLAIVVDPRELRASLDPVRGVNTVIELTVEGSKGSETLTTMLRDAHIDPLKQTMQHVDLIAIDTNKLIEAEVPLRLTGKSVGVVEGGILNVVRRKIQIRCKPTEIPTEFTIDVTELDIGDVFHVSDLTFPEGVEPAISSKLTIVTCVAPREEEVKPVAVAEGEAGAEGAVPAEGAAKPAEGAKETDSSKKE